MVYTGRWFWDPDAGGSSALSSHPLWISGYVPGAPPMPKGWNTVRPAPQSPQSLPARRQPLPRCPPRSIARGLLTNASASPAVDAVAVH
eukprot:SAG22_NODE_1676_length_3830_cov_3.388100_3_plen_89_part_00